MDIWRIICWCWKKVVSPIYLTHKLAQKGLNAMSEPFPSYKCHWLELKQRNIKFRGKVFLRVRIFVFFCKHILIFLAVFRIRIRMDPGIFSDPGFFSDPDPDPDFKHWIRPFFALIYKWDLNVFFWWGFRGAWPKRTVRRVLNVK